MYAFYKITTTVLDLMPNYSVCYMAYCWKEWDRMNIKVELVHQNIGAGRPDPNLRCNHYTIAYSRVLSAGKWCSCYWSMTGKLLTDQPVGKSAAF